MFTLSGRRRLIAIATIGSGLFAFGFVQPEPVQPEQSQSPREEAEGGAEQAADPQQLRARLQSRLDWARGFVERLEQGIARLESGEEIDPSLMREIGRGFGDGSRFRNDDRRWGDGPDGRDDGDEREMPSLEEMKAFVREHVPWLTERFAAMDEKNPGASDAMLLRAAPRIADAMEQMREDPEAAALFIEQFRLGSDIVDSSRRIRKAVESGEMTEEDARSAWRALAERHVDIRERLTRHEVERARERLLELEQDLAGDSARRTELIEEMAERMHRRSSHFGRDRRDDSSRGDGEKDGDHRRP